MKLKIITGLSGSGKTTALRAYEDMGYYAMDNSPAYLVEKFIELNETQENPIDKMAVVIDFRSHNIDNNMYKSFKSLKEKNNDTEIIYIYCSDSMILKRYNELRRPHPLGEFGNISDGIKKEKNLLKVITKISDRFIDTSNYTSKELKKVIEDSLEKKDSMIVNLLSFGYKNGISEDFDYVFDMRFLPNPYYIKDLKALNGTDKKLKKYLDQFNILDQFENDVYKIISYLIPEFKNQGKNIITIAFGCTGGKHRSVYMTERMYKRLKNEDYIVIKKHRDKEKW
ncbi:RNase adapter RapZ [Anaerococcus sp.]|uniref:RNase adapter RapZ n=1 Tax=Anaerococcus sp. TaxID=1872515 RepID=UPI0029037968|nr:RNase adapter RapZ [Anaerococcus sp.]MDU2599643.1 RNase adapter RapZ [Anaerococcus sp.]